MLVTLFLQREVLHGWTYKLCLCTVLYISGRSVGIVRSRTKGHGVCLFVLCYNYGRRNTRWYRSYSFSESTDSQRYTMRLRLQFQNH
jgi:hypothetical protein